MFGGGGGRLGCRAGAVSSLYRYTPGFTGRQTEIECSGEGVKWGPIQSVPVCVCVCVPLPNVAKLTTKSWATTVNDKYCFDRL